MSRNSKMDTIGGYFDEKCHEEYEWMRKNEDKRVGGLRQGKKEILGCTFFCFVF